MKASNHRQLKINKLVLEQNQVPLYSLLHYRGRTMDSLLIRYLTLGNNHTYCTFTHAPKYWIMSDLGIFTPLTSNDVAVYLDICFWFPRYINSAFALLIFNCTTSIQDLTLFIQSSITLMVSSSSSQLLAVNDLFTTWPSAKPIIDRVWWISLPSLLV